MTASSMPREPWDDERLNAAFAARASRARTPLDLPGATRTMLETAPTRKAAWRQVLIAAAVLVLAVGGLTVGVGMSGDRGGGTMFQQGPTADLKTFDGGDFSFDYPSDWVGYDATAEFGVGSSIAVLGTQPVEPRCGVEAHVDINCVQLQSIDTGRIRVFVGTGVYHGAAILDRSDIENGRSTQITVDGLPGILEEYAPRLDAWHREDMLVRWEIARPGTGGTNNYRIEAMLREPGVAAGRAQLDALIASIRIDAAAAPSPSAASTLPEAAGLRVMSVVEAVAIRDAGVDDHEIAVRGWFDPVPPVSCPAPLDPPVSPVQPACPDQFMWLTQEAETLTTVEPNVLSRRPPTGPAIHPDLDLVDQRWAPALPTAGPSTPVEVVFVGHFDDSASGLCPAAEELACRDRFVVDRVDSVDGASQPLSVVDRVDSSESSTIEDIRAAVDKRSLGRPILSIVINDARLEGLADGPSPTVWVARVLGEQVVEHHIVFDGIDEVFVVRMSGPPKQARPEDVAGPRGEVLGIPVISVRELIARNTGGQPSPVEVAVRGWMVRSNVVYDCAFPDIEPHPLVPRCLAPTFLMERPERPTDLTTDGPSVTPLLGLDSHVEVDIGHQDPVEVIAIGHLGDHRWRTCPPAEQDACRRVFVADRIVDANASIEALPSPWRSPQSSTSEPAVDPEEVVSWLEALFGEITVVSLGLVADGVLGEIEPAVNERDDIDAVTQLRPVWVVRALIAAGQEPTVAKTFLIPDLSVNRGPAALWEASESGVATVRRFGTGLGWPPGGATMVDTPIGRGPPPFRVAVVDETGHMVEARAPTRRESAVRDLARRTVWADDLPDGRVLVQWGGSMCDDSLTLTISASDAGTPSLLTVDGRRGSPCRSVLVSNAIVLRFDLAVRADDLAGRYLIGE